MTSTFDVSDKTVFVFAIELVFAFCYCLIGFHVVTLET